MSFEVLNPGAVLGVFGGGQIGRMWLTAAHRMGYRTVVFDPDIASPAGTIAHHHINADYDDKNALDQLIKLCDAVTTEFENIPADAFEYVQNQLVTSPNANVLRITQDRSREKEFLTKSGITVVPYTDISVNDDVNSLLKDFRFPGILKTARFGYDGKGQVTVTDSSEVSSAMKMLKAENYVLEQQINLMAELSVVVAHTSSKDIAVYPTAQNVHKNGILHTSTMPATIDPSITNRVQEIAKSIVDQLNYVGILTIEFFIASNGDIFINELAPRPHNSGHQTIDACITSQFEQQVRTMCNLPLGNTDLLSPVVLVNLLGDLWQTGDPDWNALLTHPKVKLHVYGKNKALAGRKMGHFCVLDDDVKVAQQLAQELYQALIDKD